MKYLVAIAFIFAFAFTDVTTPGLAQAPSHQVDRQKAEQDLKRAMEEMRNARTPEERQRARENLDKAKEEMRQAAREGSDNPRGPQQVSAPPSGPYQKTCYDIRVEPVTKKLPRGGHDRYERLYAICKRNASQSDSSSYLRLPCHGQVVNKGGTLRCE